MQPDTTHNKSPSQKTKKGFVLTEDDKTIFKLIYNFRFLRREHIAALTGRHSMSIYRRLSKLLATRYLSVIRLPLQKHIYALGARALPVLVEQGIGTPDLLSERIRTHELKELFLKHELMIVELHVMLELATRAGSDLRLIDWREGRELWDSVTFSDQSGRRMKLPVRADAMFTIEDLRRGEGVGINYFLEADRSSTTHSRFENKIVAYFHYRTQGLHAKKFDIQSFRVLTVAQTEARAANLCQLVASVLPEGGRKFFFFTSLEHLSPGAPASVIGNSYLSARSYQSGVREPLVPPPPKG